MTTLHLMVGLPCSGKTTLAKKLETEQRALLLTTDDWHRKLFGQDATHPEHDNRHGIIESLLWELAASALSIGTDVILDFGLWTRSERDDFRARAAALGAATIVHFLDVPHEELLARLAIRNKQSLNDITHIPPAMLKQWIPLFQPPDSDELDLNSQ